MRASCVCRACMRSCVETIEKMEYNFNLIYTLKSFYYLRVNFARIKTVVLVTSCCVCIFLTTTQWYFFIHVILYPLAAEPIRVIEDAAAFELKEIERRENKSITFIYL